MAKTVILVLFWLQSDVKLTPNFSQIPKICLQKCFLVTIDVQTNILSEKIGTKTNLKNWGWKSQCNKSLTFWLLLIDSLNYFLCDLKEHHPVICN